MDVVIGQIPVVLLLVTCTVCEASTTEPTKTMIDRHGELISDGCSSCRPTPGIAPRYAPGIAPRHTPASSPGPGPALGPGPGPTHLGRAGGQRRAAGAGAGGPAAAVGPGDQQEQVR